MSFIIKKRVGEIKKALEQGKIVVIARNPSRIKGEKVVVIDYD